MLLIILSSISSPSLLVLFFFQAEDGIRYGHVTGVQTCALPIYQRGHRQFHAGEDHAAVPRAGAPAKSFGFQHGDTDAAFRERARSGESAESRANNGDIDRKSVV